MQTLTGTSLARWAGPGALALLSATTACSGDPSSSDPNGLTSPPDTSGVQGTGGSSNTGNDGTAAQGGGTIIDPNQGMSGNQGQAGADGGAMCATVSATAKLEPLFLAFAFDVSGSMGDKSQPWYDPALKWEPALAATRAFLEDEASKGLTASLTAFPIETSSETTRCDAAKYVAPTVPMTLLPSTTFGDKLAEIRKAYWGKGTPTRAVIEGVESFVSGYRKDHPGRYAMVLVTDGYPQGCGDKNTISAIEGVVSANAAELPTYVIGVKNPPVEDRDGTKAPDTVSDLHSVARAGGTGEAFIIDTGDPAKTQADFQEAVEAIRGESIACSLAIPSPPDGRKFQKDQVVVSTTAGNETTDLEYDASCAGDKAWHYDSTTDPTEVVLCPATCARLQEAQNSALKVGFTCNQVIVIR